MHTLNAKPTLRLEATNRFLATPLVGAHDNLRPDGRALWRCVSAFRLVSGH